MPVEIHSPLSALVGYIESQRQQQRQSEDADMDRRIGLIHDLINSPGANPARTAEGIKGMLELSNAKTDPNRKRAGGMAGFMGKHAEVMPDFLSNLIHGSAPFEGKTYSESTQTTQQPGFEANAVSPVDPNTMPHEQTPAQFDGQSVLHAPVTLPPMPMKLPAEASPMLSAARQMQTDQITRTPLPQSQQPFRIDPAQLAEERQHTDAQGLLTKNAAATQADLDEATRLAPAMGMSVGEFLRQKKGLLNPTGNIGQGITPGTVTIDGQDGIPVYFDNRNHSIVRADTQETVSGPEWIGRVTNPQRLGAPRAPSAGQTPQLSIDDKGTGWLVDKMAGTTRSVGAVGKGYHPPAGPQGNVITFTDPNTGKDAMGRAVGTSVTPLHMSGDNSAAVTPKTPPLNAQIQNRMNSAQQVGSHIPEIRSEIEAADAAGVLGPMMGRWADYLAGNVGSTGDPTKDRMLGKLRTDISNIKTGFAMVHGGARGGGSPQLAARWDSIINSGKMSKQELLGAIDGIDTWLKSYAKSPADLMKLDAMGDNAASANGIPQAPSKNPYR